MRARSQRTKNQHDEDGEAKEREKPSVKDIVELLNLLLNIFITYAILVGYSVLAVKSILLFSLITCLFFC